MKSNPMISVIVPAYNTERNLNRCIQSILLQTYKNIEVIVINDGSTDGTAMKLEAYAERHSNIKVIHTENYGQSAARNLGLEYAIGELVAFVDSDDYIEQTMIEQLYDSMRYYESDVSACALRYIKGEKIKNGLLNIEASFSKEVALQYLLQAKDNESVCTKLFNLSLIKNNDIKFPEGLRHEESVFLVQFYLKASVVSYVNEPLYNYVMHESSTTQKRGGLTDYDIDLLSTADIVVGYLKDQSYISPGLLLNYQLKKRISYMYTRVRKNGEITYESQVRAWVREHFVVILKSNDIGNYLKLLVFPVMMGRGVYHPFFKVTAIMKERL